MNRTLARWNLLDVEDAALAVLPCCGSKTWARLISERRPFADHASLLAASASIWNALPARDWQEAFDSHPRIGESHPQASATEESLRWSAQEQRRVAATEEAPKQVLAEANRRYESRFGRIFIICAAGRSTDEILFEMELRMKNDDATELKRAAEEQRKITELRLGRWLEAE